MYIVGFITLKNEGLGEIKSVILTSVKSLNPILLTFREIPDLLTGFILVVKLSDEVFSAVGSFSCILPEKTLFLFKSFLLFIGEYTESNLIPFSIT